MCSLLKIWNLNKYNGVLGIFNCQGAGNWPCLEQVVRVEVSAEVSGKVTPADIEYFDEVSGKLWTGDCAVYSFAKGRIIHLAFCHTKTPVNSSRRHPKLNSTYFDICFIQFQGVCLGYQRTSHLTLH